jgi:hypothetical protein
MPRPISPEINGIAAQLLRYTGMPIPTASGTASGPAPPPSHYPTAPTGSHVIIRLSIA